MADKRIDQLTSSSGILKSINYKSESIDSYTKLLLHFDESQLIDSSGNLSNYVITTNGSIARSATQSKFGGYSAYFDGTDDYFSVDGVLSDFNFEGDFTIDLWIYPTQSVARPQHLVGCASQSVYAGTNQGGWVIGLNGTGKIAVGYQYNNSWPLWFVCNTTVSLNAWSHVAVIRNGSTITVYLNGSSDGSASYSGELRCMRNTLVGRSTVSNPPSNDDLYRGYIDELRISKGIARWFASLPTAAYTPDYYTKLLMHFDESTFVDSSNRSLNIYGGMSRNPTQSKFGSFSGYFDGVNDYITVADSPDWSFGSGNCTIDFWINFTTLKSGRNSIISHTDGVSQYWDINYDTNTLRLITSVFTDVSFSWTPTVGTWYHIALTKNGTSYTFYVNGSSIGNTTKATALPNVDGMLYLAPGSVFNGYLDEVRVSKDVVRWSNDFTPPSLPYHVSAIDNNDYFLVYDSSESSSEKLKKLSVTNYLNPIQETTTFYVSISGSDYTGDGSQSNPWADVNYALDYVSKTYINRDSSTDVTIEIGDGQYTGINTISPNRVTTNDVKIKGTNVYSKTLSSVQSSSGSAGNRLIVLNLNDVSNISVNDYVIVPYNITGGTHPMALCGFWKITNVDSGNNRITINTTVYGSNVPSGNVTGTLKILKTILNFNLNTHGVLMGRGLIKFENIGFVGNYVSDTYYGISVYNSGNLHMNNCGVNGFSHGIFIQQNAYLLAGDSAVSNSKVGYGIFVTNMGGARFLNCISSGNVTHGIIVSMLGNLQLDNTRTIGNNNYGLFIDRGGSCNCASASPFYSMYNTNQGVIVQGAGTLASTGSVVCSYNGSHGLHSSFRGNARVENIIANNNGGYGLVVQRYSYLNIVGYTATNNTSGATFSNTGGILHTS